MQNIHKFIGCRKFKHSFSLSATLTIDYEAKLKDKQTIKAGTILRLPVTVEGVPKPKVEWTHNKEHLRSTKNVQLDAKNIYHTCNVKNTTKEDSGTYKVTAKNKAGSTTAEFELMVIGKLAVIGSCNE